MEYTIKVRTDNRVVLLITELLKLGLHPNDLEKAVDAIASMKGTVELRNGPMAIMAQEAAREIIGSGTIAIQPTAGLICAKCGQIYLASDHKRYLEVSKLGKCPTCGNPWSKE